MKTGEGLWWRAREWLDSPTGRIAGISAAVVLLCAAVYLFAFRDPIQADVDSIRKQGREVTFLCESCGQTGKLHLSFDAKFPQQCPHCHQRKAVAGAVCSGCPKMLRTEDVNSLYYVCPHCGYVYDHRIPGQPDGSGAREKDGL